MHHRWEFRSVHSHPRLCLHLHLDHCPVSRTTARASRCPTAAVWPLSEDLIHDQSLLNLANTSSVLRSINQHLQVCLENASSFGRITTKAIHADWLFQFGIEQQQTKGTAFLRHDPSVKQSDSPSLSNIHVREAATRCSPAAWWQNVGYLSVRSDRRGISSLPKPETPLLSGGKMSAICSAV